MAGDSPGSIVASLPDEHPLTVRQLMDHFRAHLPLANEAVARFRDSEADRRGALVTEGADRVVTAMAFARRVMRQVDVRIEHGEVQPTVSDALRAAALLAPAEVDNQAGITQDDAYNGFLAYARAIQNHTTPEQANKIGADLRADPLMRSLLERRAAQE